ncbi:uncharacterized protein LOC141513400 [Macrotis lagotis]|uniref:uncharacterized protein LOC141513400 n=1 Tax=Macrotis lagotis TaxID=92651 RepID=UPI003D692448
MEIPAAVTFSHPRPTWSRFLWLHPLLLIWLFPSNCNLEMVSSLNRTRGDEVVFHLDSQIGNETQIMRWYLESRSLLLLTMSPGKSSPSWIIPQKEYEDRLFAPNDTSLKLINLTPEDSGCYENHVISSSGEIRIQRFNLTVSETVNTESNKNPWIWIIVIVIAILVLLFFWKQTRNCLFIKDILRRWNIAPVPNQREERRLQEECALFQLTSVQIKKHKSKTEGVM